jgi:uncharacterized membrane protein
MAGIGFELQKLVRKGTLSSTIQAFLYGSILSSGPVLLTILTVGIIAWLSYGIFHLGALNIFTVTIVYTFAFSLILTGAPQIVFTRYVADKEFAKLPEHIYPGLLTSLALVSGLALLVAIPFYATLDVYAPVGNVLLYKIFAVLTFWGVSLVWQLMGFISTSKEYQKIVWSYFGGTVVSIVLAYFLVPKIAVVGGVAGFCLGQWFIAGLIFYITTRYLPKKKRWCKEYFSYFHRYPRIALVGLFYNIGIWADKFVFWNHFRQQQGASLFFTFNFYDVPNFVAFLTIIPALAYFLILTETNFYKDYSGFIKDVLSQPLLLIERKKDDMIATLKEGMKGMIRLQGIVTLLLIVFARPVLIFIHYHGVSIWLFRVMLIGVFFHVVNLNINIIFLYYEMRKKALEMTLLFAGLNFLLTWVSIQLGTPFYGLGFLLATGVTTAISWPLLLKSVRKIDFLIFASQPLDAIVKAEKQTLWQKVKGRFSRVRDRLNGKEKIYAEFIE